MPAIASDLGTNVSLDVCKMASRKQIFNCQESTKNKHPQNTFSRWDS